MILCGPLNRLDHPKHAPYEAVGGYLREEAIMVLRRFYITENTNGESEVFFDIRCIFN